MVIIEGKLDFDWIVKMGVNDLIWKRFVLWWILVRIVGGNVDFDESDVVELFVFVL